MQQFINEKTHIEVTNLKIMENHMVEDFETMEETIKRIKELETSYMRLLELLREKGHINEFEKIKLEID